MGPVQKGRPSNVTVAKLEESALLSTRKSRARFLPRELMDVPSILGLSEPTWLPEACKEKQSEKQQATGSHGGPACSARLSTTRCPPGRMFTSLLLTQARPGHCRTLPSPLETERRQGRRKSHHQPARARCPRPQRGAINHAGKAVGCVPLCKVLPRLLWGTPPSSCLPETTHPQLSPSAPLHTRPPQGRPRPGTAAPNSPRRLSRS